MPGAEGRVIHVRALEMRPRSKLEDFGGYRKALELFDVIVADLTPFGRHPVCAGLVRQQVDAADSICANLEEGYGRGSKKEFIHIIRIARGSAREVLGRCDGFRHWLRAEAVVGQSSLANEVVAILSRSLKTLESR